MNCCNNLNGLKFNVVDNITGNGINEATFVLTQNNTIIRSATSKLGGEVTFKIVFPGYYTLKQTTAPAGYNIDPNTYNVYINNGYFNINGNSCNFVIKNTRI